MQIAGENHSYWGPINSVGRTRLQGVTADQAEVAPFSNPSAKRPSSVALSATAEIDQYSGLLRSQLMVVELSPGFEEHAPLAQEPSSLHRTVWPEPGSSVTQ